MILGKFFAAVSKNWIALVTGVASVPLSVLAFWVDTPAIRIVWAISALVCFIMASYQVWANEYRRAERTTAVKPKPYVTIDGYKTYYAEDDSGKECLIEKLRVVNRGGAAALSIEIPPIRLFGRTARLLIPLPTLGPDESTEGRILNLKYVLDGVLDKMPKVRGIPWKVTIPLTVRYRDDSHDHLKTDHAISYSAMGISFSIVHPNEPQDWTDLTLLKQ